MYNSLTMKKIEISTKTILFTAALVIGLIFLFMIKDLIFSLLIAFIIAGALRQPVDFLEKRRLPRSVAAFFIYVLFIFGFFYLLTLIVPPLAIEIIHLSRTLPRITKESFPYINTLLNVDFIFQNLPGFANQTIDFVKNIFSNVLFITSTLFFGFYFLRENDLETKLLGDFLAKKQISRIQKISHKAQNKMSAWFWGEIILMVVVGGLTYIGLALLKIKYSLALAVLAGLLEVIPNLGPIISAVPAFLISSSQSLFIGLTVLGLYFVVQQLENNLIVPVVMKKATGLHPITILIALVVGGKIAGILGVFIAVPTTIVLETIIIELKSGRN